MVVSHGGHPDIDRVFGALADTTRRDIVGSCDRRERGRRRARGALPDELRGRAEARRGAGAGGPGHQGADRAPQGRPHQRRAGSAWHAACSIDTRSCGGDASTACPSSSPTRRRPTHDRDRRPQGPEALTMTSRPSSTRRPSGSGSSGPTRASWSAGGARRPTPRPSPSTTCARRPHGVPHDRPGRRPAARAGGRSSRSIRRAAIVFRDGFANADGTARTRTCPAVTVHVTIEDIGDGRTPDVDHRRLPRHRGDGAAPRHGHGGGPHPGRRPDRRHPRRSDHEGVA